MSDEHDDEPRDEHEDEPDDLEDEDEVDDAEPRRFDCTGGDAATVAAAIEAARCAVEEGECVVLPTDTVYGIGADAFSPDAVQRLLHTKNRGRDMPPPVLVGDASLIRALATDVPDQARELVDAHWPGALTIVVRIQPSLRMDLGDTDGSIALRVPDHDLAREILRRTGPLAVSSANISGRPAALTCDDAYDQLGDRVAVYLDGGALRTDAGDGHGLPSTIVDFTRYDDGEVLRRGALDVETLRQTVPGLRDLDEPERDAEPEPPADDPEPPAEPQAAGADPKPPAEPDPSGAEPEPPRTDA